MREGAPTSNRERSNGETRRQFVKFSFFKLDPTYRRLPATRQRLAKLECVGAIQTFHRRMLIRSYSLVGLRGDADFMLWQVADAPDAFQELMTAIRNTELGRYLEMPHSLLAITRRSAYAIGSAAREAEAEDRTVIAPSEHKYLFVYPFVKTRAWYGLPFEERQQMMTEHIRVGRKYPQIKLNTTYSFGIDDQEFVVAFEGDNPADFVDLVMELRESEASRYTLRDTPMFTCRSLPLAETLDTLGGPPIADQVGTDVNDADGWVDVMDLTELPPGSSASAVADGQWVALFNVGGQIYAIANRCPHARGPLSEGVVECEGERRTVICPWHYSRFDLATGAVVDGMARDPATPFDTEIRGGTIYVRARTTAGQPA